MQEGKIKEEKSNSKLDVLDHLEKNKINLHTINSLPKNITL